MPMRMFYDDEVLGVHTSFHSAALPDEFHRMKLDLFMEFPRDTVGSFDALVSNEDDHPMTAARESALP